LSTGFYNRKPTTTEGGSKYIIEGKKFKFEAYSKLNERACVLGGGENLIIMGRGG